MPIDGKVSSEETSSNSLCLQEELQEECITSIEYKASSKSSSVTTSVDTQSSFESLDTLEVIPKGILLKARTSCIPPPASAIETRFFYGWAQQPIPDSLPSSTSRRQRRRGTTESTSNRYDRVKTTRFPLREEEEEDRERKYWAVKQKQRIRKRHPKKTVLDEQWVITCRFLW
ncbi:unnamed protein product [Cylindrotheca closterium]|uniref:Uncharacterized protein n=1 Tax=Cylindrotheca closterium TaxID=2856 RepID=A0AAD2FNZ6_9STRA|nr:unnamed protein product [Cylindrotheca closterium]